MNILLVGFHKNDAKMYPHLRTGMDILSREHQVDYFHFRERGVNLGYVFGQFFNSQFYKLLFISIADGIKLFRMRNKYDLIIATDEFIYAVVSLIFKQRVILWSFDFIYIDNKLHNTFLYKWAHSVCNKLLKKNKKMIIQDNSRLVLFLKSIRCEDFKPDVFLLPVSLFSKEHYRIFPTHKMLIDTPVIMQHGGIVKSKSSDKILNDYQKNYDKYELYFHSILVDELIKIQYNNCKVKPCITVRPLRDLLEFIQYCDIGFISYDVDYYKMTDLNSWYNINAAGQFVEFIRMGKPVIVMGNTDLKGFVNYKEVGIGIDNIDELVSAINMIKNNYKLYSENCYDLFYKQYNIEKYTDKLLEWIEK